MRCQLFVEVEIALHCLSDTMKTSAISNYIPNFFSDVADLSATLLIDTTNSLFRRLPNGKKDTILSLEYLASRLSVSDAASFPTITHPADAVYSFFLAIAKNTNPSAATGRKQNALALTLAPNPSMSATINHMSTPAKTLSSSPFVSQKHLEL